MRKKKSIKSKEPSPVIPKKEEDEGGKKKK